MLPLVDRPGAPEAAAGFIAKIKDHPELAARVKGYIRVAERRWDLRLENGITVKLPEAGEDQAIDELVDAGPRRRPAVARHRRRSTCGLPTASSCS